MDDLHHPLDLLRGNGPAGKFLKNRFRTNKKTIKNIYNSPSSGLLPQQVHDVGGELAAGLVVLLQLLRFF